MKGICNKYLHITSLHLTEIKPQSCFCMFIFTGRGYTQTKCFTTNGAIFIGLMKQNYIFLSIVMLSMNIAPFKSKAFFQKVPSGLAYLFTREDCSKPKEEPSCSLVKFHIVNFTIWCHLECNIIMNYCNSYCDSIYRLAPQESRMSDKNQVPD